MDDTLAAARPERTLRIVLEVRMEVVGVSLLPTPPPRVSAGL